MLKKNNIVVVGIGYVGLSLAVLLAQTNKVTIIDIDSNKVDLINSRLSPIKDEYIEKYLTMQKLDLKATLSTEQAYKNADFVIVAAPTNYDPSTNSFDTSIVEEIVTSVIKFNKNATIVIKSTIPVGYTKLLRKKTGYRNILFCPEFLRESKALYDNLHPSRIIVGTDLHDNNLVALAHKVGELLHKNALKKNIDILIMGFDEAEAVKLFSNSYLALRVSYFNELDTYAEIQNLCTKDIIEGVCLDPRIGFHYNNPSFGYGGYCLPKDTKQLLSNFNKAKITENLIQAAINSNDYRKKFITSRILNMVQKDNDMDLSQYLGHILVETVTPFFLLLILQISVGLDSESNYGFDFGYKILQCS
ncbi:nucleotide sugar dehydrogenase [Enterococcus faecium]|nr:nucleotide sugar dehydrogenase [Enterococcus faecium]